MSDSDIVHEEPGVSVLIFRVAWLAILLGVGTELALIAANSVLGRSSSFGSFVADLVQKISWSVFVCVGLAIGLSVSKMKVPAGIIAGLLAAPIAFAIARTLHKSLSQGLGVAGGTGAVSPVVMALAKGCEYALLGGAIAWYQSRNLLQFRAYALTGAAVGAVFAVLFATVGAPVGDSAASRIAKAINEFLAPFGCALVQYGAKALGVQAVAKT